MVSVSVVDAEERALRSTPERVQKIESVADDLDAERAGVLREVGGSTMLSCWSAPTRKRAWRRCGVVSSASPCSHAGGPDRGRLVRWGEHW